ncbi:arsenate reductase (glutaredoxin) [Defluviimonas sp. SAOS-178_SWC]|uniref:arsenate reductase (glutaredoxin) n=1 Tax=Defluviimonas sp. SAOS-178_SWC TaxID=3121287 RepID=UPI00322192CC
MTTIWHNPRCSKSRETLALLTARGIEPNVRLYLQDPPSVVEIRAALAALGMPAIALARTGDALFRELGLTRDIDEDTLIAAMAAHPALIERPLVRHGNRARLGRPPEAVLDLF